MRRILVCALALVLAGCSSEVLRHLYPQITQNRAGLGQSEAAPMLPEAGGSKTDAAGRKQADEPCVRPGTVLGKGDRRCGSPS